MTGRLGERGLGESYSVNDKYYIVDKLEKRIQELRGELESVEQPDRAKIWAEVQRQQGLTPINTSKQTMRGFLMGVAASVAVLLVAGAGWWVYQNAVTEPTPVAVNLPPQWAQEQQEYKQLIENKKQELRLENIDRDAYREVLKELEEIEKMQQAFEEELLTLPKDDKTIQTLMRYYEQKIRILEILSKEIQIKQHEEARNDTNQSI